MRVWPLFLLLMMNKLAAEVHGQCHSRLSVAHLCGKKRRKMHPFSIRQQKNDVAGIADCDKSDSIWLSPTLSVESVQTGKARGCIAFHSLSRKTHSDVSLPLPPLT